ncbi:MAG: YdiU family protein [Hyphomicrobiales bacterium]
MIQPVFDITYNKLPQQLFSNAHPDLSPNPKFTWTNAEFAIEIGMDDQWLNSKNALSFFTGKSENTEHPPLAMAYSGHQFGHFSPQLGDGRALLIGEYVSQNKTRYDVHLKGSGSTVYSRRGDGKSTLRAALKECLFSEYLAAINIPTTRSLGVLTTGETVMRETPHQGAVLVRMAKSLIRVGTFQYASMLDQNSTTEPKNNITQLADFLIAREYKNFSLTDPNRHQLLFSNVVSRQASLIAQWMSQGFIHGVMNTDNMALSGETIDFGPCAFMERFKIDQVFSSIDKNGRYAWNKQADIAIWNLSKLASAMLPLFNTDQPTAIEFAESELNQFSSGFSSHLSQQIMNKIGLNLKGQDASDMMNQTFTMLSHSQADYTLFFRKLGEYLIQKDTKPLFELCIDPLPLENWLTTWQNHIKLENKTPSDIADNMALKNPIYVPRFHLVEHALDQASAGSLSEFNSLLQALSSPYVENPKFSTFALPPTGQKNEQTFCET